jgi:hypothetical protein
MSLTQGSFVNAGQSLEVLLALRLPTRTLKHMSRVIGRLAAAVRGLAEMQHAKLHAQALTA